MAILPLVHIPDPILRAPSKPIERFDGDLQKFLDSMLETMYDAPGIGLAAVQVGEPIRVVTIDCAEREVNERGEEDPDPKREPIFLINPEIVATSDAPNVYEEGCLSIPDYYAEVERPAECTVKFLDRDGKEQTLEADGIMATCIQHEVDHLNGVLFIDYLSKLKRDMVVRKFTKIAKQSGKPFIG
ncbi:peptide deformylase [Pseudahrensia aquimaris]|uniref:Peptide deformylase n=1 Tax=Pseudahrensia aquimaris TaxID=744461 RepID=A0ABW3FJS8_9HYPH